MLQDFPSVRFLRAFIMLQTHDFFFNSLYFYCNNWCFLLQINLQQNKLLVKHFFIAASTFFLQSFVFFVVIIGIFLLQINLQKKIVG
jgi:hypothetical protein